MTTDASIELLRSWFSHNGLVLCNQSRELPALEDVGGDWKSIVALMESGEVFYSKLYKRRVTYLSRELYYHMKPLRRRAERLTDAGRETLSFLESVGMASTAEIKRVLSLSNKDYFEAMESLSQELFVTVIERDRDLGESWSAFCYGPAELWEAKRPEAVPEPDVSAAERLLRGVMSEKQLAALLK